MLIEHYDVHVFTPPCNPAAEGFSAKALLTVDISEVLPYLNATLQGSVYTQAAAALTWRNGERHIAFHAYEIGASNVEDREAAIQALAGLVDLVNRTWERRAEIAPDTVERQRPTAMALYRLLPGTNCRQCGLASCWNFALKLAAAQVELTACPPLAEPAYAERLAALAGLIAPMPAIGPRDEGRVSG